MAAWRPVQCPADMDQVESLGREGVGDDVVAPDFQVRVVEVLEERGLQVAGHHGAAGADALAQP
jgi:hypothetical protein